MQITSVFTGDDGHSHFEELSVELADQGAVGAISAMWPTKGVIFRSVGGDYDLGFHNAPRRQFVVNLTGSVDIEISDGAVKRPGPGSILLAEDTTGRGHKSSSVAGEPRTCLFIPLSSTADTSVADDQ